jgi:rhamnosyl/mannosyltransferase
MIYGRPVINTDLPTGVPWVSVHNESGLTVPVSDSEALADAIKQLYMNQGLYDRLSKGAKQRVTRLFLSDKTNEQLYKLYFGVNI